MHRLFSIVVLILIFAMIATLAWVSNHLDVIKKRLPAKPLQSQIHAASPAETSSPTK